MRPNLFMLFITIFLLTACTAIASEVRDTQEVTPKSTVNYMAIPEDPQVRAEMLQNLEPGNCTFFLFLKKFTPSNPEQTSLRPGLVLNTRAYPPYTVQGYCISRDTTGLRAEEFEQKSINDQIEKVRSVYASGNRIFRQTMRSSDPAPVESMIENEYLDCDGHGVQYFLNSVYLKGIITGQKMETLLGETNARQIGVENIRGTRTIVYGINPTKKDFLNEFRYLQVWVRVGDYKLIRTNLDLICGQELTEFSRHAPDVHFDDSRFLLPGETVQDMIDDCNMVLNPQPNVSDSASAQSTQPNE